MVDELDQHSDLEAGWHYLVVGRPKIKERAEEASQLLHGLVEQLEAQRPDLPPNTPIAARNLLELSVSQARAAIALLNLSIRYDDLETLSLGTDTARASGRSAGRVAALLLAGGMLNPVASDAWEGVKDGTEAIIQALHKPGLAESETAKRDDGVQKEADSRRAGAALAAEVIAQARTGRFDLKDVARVGPTEPYVISMIQGGELTLQKRGVSDQRLVTVRVGTEAQDLDYGTVVNTFLDTIRELTPLSER